MNGRVHLPGVRSNPLDDPVAVFPDVLGDLLVFPVPADKDFRIGGVELQLEQNLEGTLPSLPSFSHGESPGRFSAQPRILEEVESFDQGERRIIPLVPGLGTGPLDALLDRIHGQDAEGYGQPFIEGDLG